MEKISSKNMSHTQRRDTSFHVGNAAHSGTEKNSSNTGSETMKKDHDPVHDFFDYIIGLTIGAEEWPMEADFAAAKDSHESALDHYRKENVSLRRKAHAHKRAIREMNTKINVQSMKIAEYKDEIEDFRREVTYLKDQLAFFKKYPQTTTVSPYGIPLKIYYDATEPPTTCCGFDAAMTVSDEIKPD